MLTETAKIVFFYRNACMQLCSATFRSRVFTGKETTESTATVSSCFILFCFVLSHVCDHLLLPKAYRVSWEGGRHFV